MIPAVRPDLESLTPYLAPQVEAPVRLNTNECAFPLPPTFAQDLAEAVTRIPFHRYPDREATALREGLSGSTGHPAEGIWVANGSNEVIQHLCLAFGGPGRRALLFDPTYSMHSLIPRMVGTPVVRECLPEDFVLRPSEAVEAVRRHRPSLTFVCSPNNPTGNAQPLQTVEALCSETEGLVLVDEAYIEFGGASAQLLLERFDNLVVVRTFSKAFSLAAARLGYALAAPELVGELPRVRLPYHLSSLSLAAGEVALRHRDEARAVLAVLREQRDRIVAFLSGLEGVEPYATDANFVLFRTPFESAAVWQALLDRGVLIRDVSKAAGLERCLRVSAGTPDETSAFLSALPEVLEAMS